MFFEYDDDSGILKRHQLIVVVSFLLSRRVFFVAWRRRQIAHPFCILSLIHDESSSGPVFRSCRKTIRFYEDRSE